METISVPNKPEKVNIALRLLYISLVVFLLEMIAQVIQASKTIEFNFLSFVWFPLIYVGIMRFLYYMIGKGQNWSRIVILVLFIGGIPYIFPLLSDLFTNPIRSLVGIGQTGIQITALVFLFQKSSSDWFREMKGK